MVTTDILQERRGVTNDAYHVEEHHFASDGEVIRYWALKLYEAQNGFTRGGSIFALLGPIGVLQRFNVSQSDIDAVIRASSRLAPFPFELFQDKAA